MSAKISRTNVLALAILFFLFPAKIFSQEIPADEKYLLDAVNRERAAANLHPLKWDANLASAARAHARKMVDHNRLSHQFSGEPDLTARCSTAGARFSSVAENG